MDLRTAEAIIEIDKRVKSATSQFYNSAVASTVYDPVLGDVVGEIELTVTDLLLIAILSQVHVLVTGPTGRGKTDLVKLVCQGVFGKNGWFLLRLNPHLTEETFANIDMKKLADGVLRDAVSPSPFLQLPCTILDEVNRTPAALTNILLGFCDGRIELKCGLKYDVGNKYKDRDQQDRWYHFVVGTMNEGREYSGTFELDPALNRRFTLQIPFGQLRPTPSDLVNIIENRTGPTTPADETNAVEKIAAICDEITQLALEPLAMVYLIYLGNVGRCPHSPSGFHTNQASQELCSKTQCRIQKIANSFCPSFSGLSEGVLIYLKRTACGLAALRAAQTIEAVRGICKAEDSEHIDKLREFSNTETSGDELQEAVVSKYLETIVVTADDIKALVPFVSLGGKVWVAKEYVAKHFAGSPLLAMQEYVRLTYSRLENFFRNHKAFFEQLDTGNGAVKKQKKRLEHAERFNDPSIRHTIEPLLVKHCKKARGPDEIAEEIEMKQAVRNSAFELVW
jgi:MoxR-like ATPase